MSSPPLIPTVRSRPWRAAALLIALLVPIPPAAADRLDGFDEFASKMLREWKVPGAAVAVVHDGTLILANGYGRRNLKDKLPVTPKTLFAIGSVTKSFTVISLALLAEQGKLDWDKPVREYLPDFRLHDAAATERMTARDLVTHRSGLPRHDLMWYSSTFTRQQMYDRLRYLEPSRDFRSAYQYQNLMFMTAGYLAGRLSDMPWEDHVRRHVLTPLGMTSTNLSVLESGKSSDHALPYRTVKDQVTEIPFHNIDEIGPAGSINSNIEDMTRYLMMHMSRGKAGGKQFLAESSIRPMHSPQMVIPGEVRYSELGHSSYGMGWTITSYHGRKLVQHGGNIDGFSALLGFLPEEKIGLVILTNSNDGTLTGVLSRHIFDRMLGIEPVPWSDRFRADEQKQKAAQEEATRKGYTPKRAGTRPSHELKDYAGEYEHPAYGIVKLSLEKDALRGAFNGLGAAFQHLHYDVFEAAEDPGNPIQKMKMQFHSNLQGDIESLSLPLETLLKPIVFTRRAAPAWRQRSYLEPLAGEYALGAVTAVISLRDEHTLIAALSGTASGQPPVELLPTRELVFNLKGMTGFSIEFRKDASGAVTELVFHQPNGTFAAKRK